MKKGVEFNGPDMRVLYQRPEERTHSPEVTGRSLTPETYSPYSSSTLSTFRKRVAIIALGLVFTTFIGTFLQPTIAPIRAVYAPPEPVIRGLTGQPLSYEFLQGPHRTLYETQKEFSDDYKGLPSSILLRNTQKQRLEITDTERVLALRTAEATMCIPASPANTQAYKSLVEGFEKGAAADRQVIGSLVNQDSIDCLQAR